jgi:hypothetical protein
MSRHWEHQQACRRKVKYRSYERARCVFSAGVLLFASIHIYNCPVCGGWHLGNWREFVRARTSELYREIREAQSDPWPVMEFYRNRSLASKEVS